MCDDPFFISFAPSSSSFYFHPMKNQRILKPSGSVNTLNSEHKYNQWQRQMVNDKWYWCTVAAMVGAVAAVVEWWKQHKRINFPFIFMIRAYAPASLRLLIKPATIFDRIKFSNTRKIVFSSVSFCERECMMCIFHIHAHGKHTITHPKNCRKKWNTMPLREDKLRTTIDGIPLR